MRAIFIGGSGRNGTTLLGAMLGAHKECLTTPESQFKIEALRLEGGTHRDIAWNRIYKHWKFRVWGMHLDPSVVPKREIGESYRSMLEWCVTRYGEHVGKRDFSVWVDHTPSNIRYLSTLLTIFPEAKAIHMVRDGRGVAASFIPRDRGANTVVGAAHLWVKDVSYGLAAESAFGRDRIVRVRYEDLVTSPEEVLKGLCSWLGIDYEPEMAKAGGFRPPTDLGKYHPLIGKEPDRERASAWEWELTPRQIEVFERHTAEFLPYLGYELKYGLRARGTNTGEIIRFLVVECCMGVVNKIRLICRIRKIVKRSA